MAVITPTASARRAGPKAKSRRGYRCSAPVPVEPTGVEVLAAIKHARAHEKRAYEWDARVESSAIALVAYLWRRGIGEKWAGRNGSGRYACSIAQLVIGLAGIMGWRDVPDRGDHVKRARFVRAHRKSVQEWLDWVALAGLVSHTPQRDEDGFWWRTIIELHPTPQLDPELLSAAVDRRQGWWAREHTRELKGRQRPAGARARNLTAILRRARLNRAERRARSAARRRLLREHNARQAVRAAVCEGIADAAKTNRTQPYGPETRSQGTTNVSSKDSPLNRRIPCAQPREIRSDTGDETTKAAGKGERVADREEDRWAVYREVLANRYAPDQANLEARLANGERRLAQLADWPAARPCPRWRLIEAWTVAAYGPQMAAADGFRLAFWSEQREHHGPRLERALARYERYADARQPGWPAAPIAALARFLAEQVERQADGPAHGMAYDVARFNELTKQMSAYHHYQRAEHLAHAAKRARRRQRVRELAEQVNQRLGFRLASDAPAARVRTARDLLDSTHPAHQDAGRALYAAEQREQRLQERAERLLAGRHPGLADGRYLAACRHAERCGLPAPSATVNKLPGAGA